MKSSRSLFSSNGDKRGQAYTLEAIIAVTLIVAVVLFVAPSFATPTSHADVEQAKFEHSVSEDVASALEHHRSNGEMKSLILDWHEDASDPTYDAGWNPDEGPRGTEIPHYQTLQISDSDGLNPFLADLYRIEQNQDVRVGVYLIPESEIGDENPDREKFVEPPSDGSVVTSESVTVTLYDDDSLQSDADVHTRHGTVAPQYSGDGDSLGEDGHTFPIDESDNSAGENVYNVVEVQVVVYADDG